MHGTQLKAMTNWKKNSLNSRNFRATHFLAVRRLYALLRRLLNKKRLSANAACKLTVNVQSDSHVRRHLTRRIGPFRARHHIWTVLNERIVVAAVASISYVVITYIDTYTIVIFSRLVVASVCRVLVMAKPFRHIRASL